MSSQTIVFRVDASVRIGTGHVMRCLTLADELRDRGAECHFIHRALDGNMVQAIRERGFPVHPLEPSSGTQPHVADGDYRAWAGVTDEQDAMSCVPILKAINARQVVVDHYGFGATWHALVRPCVDRITVIDDLANRVLMGDVLINQNLTSPGGDVYDGLVPERCLRLCGPEYALLAPSYSRAREFTGPRRGPLSRILVFFGGSDPGDETRRAVKVLCRPEFTNLAVDVVIGRNYDNVAELRSLCTGRSMLEVHQGLPSLLPLMLDADLAIGAGGTTSWERCCVGLPAVVVPIAENQVPSSHALAAAGASVLLAGASDSRESQEAAEEALAVELRALRADPMRLRAMADAAWRLGEGRGVGLVGEVLMPSDPGSLRLRRATSRDVWTYFRWANDSEVRSSAFESGQIEWPQHQAWFRARLASSESYLWALECQRGVPMGQFRVDLREGQGVVDYSVERAVRGRGLGRRIIELGVEAWRRAKPGVPLVAKVKTGNAPSLRAFEGSRYFQRLAQRVDDGTVSFRAN